MPSKPPFAFDTVNETENLLAVEQLCQITEIMHYLEIPMLLIHPGNELSDNIFQQKSTALKHLSYLCGYLKKGNLILSIENPLPHHLGGRFEEFSFFMDKLKYDNVGWCIDTSHLLLSNETEKFLEKYTDRIIHTHLSDNLGKFDDHVIPSEGIVDWKKIYSILTKDSYTGKINFEILNSFSEDYKNGISLTEKLKKYIIETFPDLK
jgi:sugar phosphate isomerase/epimerase